MRCPVLLLAASLALCVPSIALAQLQCGSPVIDRPLNDATPGLVCIYRGGTQPLTGPGRVERWSFYNNELVSSAQVTPLILERLAADSWKVVCVGTSRTASNAGVQSHNFDALVGSATLLPGKQYTVGFTHRSYSLSGQTLVPGNAHYGIVDFTGYNIFTDQWSYATAIPELDTVYGSGGSLVDGLGFPGRIYSVQFELSGVYQLPGCFGNPAQLSAPVTQLSPGSATQLALSSPTIPSGVALCLAGAPGYGASGCGLFLPGIGELFFTPGTEFTVASGGLSLGLANLPLAVPNQPSLIGKKVLLQGVAGGVLGGDLVVALSNGLQATIAP
jgi:hypothetical protein